MFGKRTIDWRSPQNVSSSLPFACDEFFLSDGLILSERGIFLIDQSVNATFGFLCENGMPCLSSVNKMLSRLGIGQTSFFASGWKQYLDETGALTVLPRYSYSVYPFVVSLCTSLVVTLFCTSIIFTKHYLTAFKPGLLMKAACIISSAQMIAINVMALTNLQKQAQLGKSISRELLGVLMDSKGLNVMYLIGFFFLLMCQVDIVKRLYPRRKERKSVVAVGTFLVVLTETLWGVSNFTSDARHYVSNIVISDDDSMLSVQGPSMFLSILPAFIYLLEISLSMMFSCILMVYCTSKRKFLKNWKMAPITVVMLLGVNTPICFFIADISNVWVNKLSDLFNMVSYVVTNVTTWEWLNRVEQMRKYDQKRNVLGRPFFLDNYVARSKDETEGVGSAASQESSYNLRPQNLAQIREMVAGYREKVESRVTGQLRRFDRWKRHTGKKASIGRANPSRDVYLYRPKKVVINDVNENRRSEDDDGDDTSHDNNADSSTPDDQSSDSYEPTDSGDSDSLPSEIRNIDFNGTVHLSMNRDINSL